MEKQKGISFICSCLFGYICIGLSIFISIEVIMRKLFSASLQGADELGGYVLAITSVIAFCVALIGNNHIRIDIFHYKFPKTMQAILNWIAMFSVFFIAVLLAYTAIRVLQETISYGSTTNSMGHPAVVSAIDLVCRPCVILLPCQLLFVPGYAAAHHRTIG